MVNDTTTSYTGTLDGDTLSGTYSDSSDGNYGAWTVTRPSTSTGTGTSTSTSTGTGTGTSTSTTTAVPPASFAEIAGTWKKKKGSGSLQFDVDADGTIPGIKVTGTASEKCYNTTDGNYDSTTKVTGSFEKIKIEKDFSFSGTYSETGSLKYKGSMTITAKFTSKSLLTVDYKVSTSSSGSNSVGTFSCSGSGTGTATWVK